MDVEVSNEIKDLLRHLICPADQRFGKNGLDDFKRHPFFGSIDWNSIRRSSPPDQPELNGPMDTSHFDEVEPEISTRVKMKISFFDQQQFPKNIFRRIFLQHRISN